MQQCIEIEYKYAKMRGNRALQMAEREDIIEVHIKWSSEVVKHQYPSKGGIIHNDKY